MTTEDLSPTSDEAEEAAKISPEDRSRVLAGNFTAELFEHVEAAQSVAVFIEYGAAEDKTTFLPVLLSSRDGDIRADHMLRLMRKISQGQLLLLRAVQSAVNNLQEQLVNIAEQVQPPASADRDPD